MHIKCTGTKQGKKTQKMLPYHTNMAEWKDRKTIQLALCIRCNKSTGVIANYRKSGNVHFSIIRS